MIIVATMCQLSQLFSQAVVAPVEKKETCAYFLFHLFSPNNKQFQTSNALRNVRFQQKHLLKNALQNKHCR